MQEKALYPVCPNCGSRLEGAAVHQCTRCGAQGCLKVEQDRIYGCWLDNDCPECVGLNRYRIVGEVAPAAEPLSW